MRSLGSTEPSVYTGQIKANYNLWKMVHLKTTLIKPSESIKLIKAALLALATQAKVVLQQ